MKKRLYITYYKGGDFALEYFTFKPGTAFPEKKHRILYIEYDLELAIKHFRNEYGLKGVKLERCIFGQKNTKDGK